MWRKVVVMVAVFTVGAAWAYEQLPSQAPIPKDNPQTALKIKLGKQLYFDKRLSGDDSVSCNSCHDLNRGGVDHLALAKGGVRNTPTVWNAAYQSVQFWDGRAATLEDQAKAHLLNPAVMGMKEMKDLSGLVNKIKGIKGYRKGFKKAFGKTDPVTGDNIVKALASYERTLVVHNSPFDRYLAGNKTALGKEAKAGMILFETIGCVSCHTGPNFSGPTLPVGEGFYMRFPNFPDTAYDKKYEFSKDMGRYQVTKDPAHKNMFRVPSLRNVALTAPYFSNGAVSDLSEAVRIMAKVQLNRDLSKDEADKLVAFLHSLTSRLPRQHPPRLPR